MKANTPPGQPGPVINPQGEVITNRFVPNVLTEYISEHRLNSDDAKGHVFKSTRYKLPIEHNRSRKSLGRSQNKRRINGVSFEHVASILLCSGLDARKHLTIWLAGPTR